MRKYLHRAVGKHEVNALGFLLPFPPGNTTMHGELTIGTLGDLTGIHQAGRKHKIVPFATRLRRRVEIAAQQNGRTLTALGESLRKPRKLLCEKWFALKIPPRHMGACTPHGTRISTNPNR